VGQEYARQRQYLEKTVESLKKKLAADVETHRVEGLRVMQQNVALIKEINELRREIKVSLAVWVGGDGCDDCRCDGCEQGGKLLGLLLTGSTGQHMAGRNGLA
jgi:hypothetical protein